MEPFDFPNNNLQFLTKSGAINSLDELQNARQGDITETTAQFYFFFPSPFQKNPPNHRLGESGTNNVSTYMSKFAMIACVATPTLPKKWKNHLPVVRKKTSKNYKIK